MELILKINIINLYENIVYNNYKNNSNIYDNNNLLNRLNRNNSIRENFNSIKKLTFLNIITLFLTLCLFFLSFSCFKIFPNIGDKNPEYPTNIYSNEYINIDSNRNLDEKECSIKLLSNIELVSKDKFNEVDDKLILGKYIPKYLYEHSKIIKEELKYYHSNNSNEETYTNSRLITKREVNIYILDDYIIKPTYTTFKYNAYNQQVNLVMKVIKVVEK